MPAEHTILVVVELYLGDASLLDQLGSRFESINLTSTIDYPPGSEQTLPKNVFIGQMTHQDCLSALKSLRTQVEGVLEQLHIRKADRKILYLATNSFSMSLDKD